MAKAKRTTHNPGAFLDLPPEASAYDASAAVILPLPFEESVSYGGGTAAGPEAIVAASQQVELYQRDRDAEPALIYGVHTLPTPAFLADGAKRKSAAVVLDGIAREAEKHLASGKLLVGLGGEHTVSLGLARAVAAIKGAFTLVHIDAHADLRDSYQDNPFSHACVVRRIAELPECEAILQFGIRSLCADQAAFIREHAPRRQVRPAVRSWSARDMRRDKSWRRKLARAVSGRRVFFTFDVDGLDPSIVPATGTPEPDGLTWRRYLRLVDIVAEHAGKVVAMDCVELAPAPGLHHADFTVARALYESISAFLLGPAEKDCSGFD